LLEAVRQRLRTPVERFAHRGEIDHSGWPARGIGSDGHASEGSTNWGNVEKTRGQGNRAHAEPEDLGEHLNQLPRRQTFVAGDREATGDRIMTMRDDRGQDVINVDGLQPSTVIVPAHRQPKAAEPSGERRDGAVAASSEDERRFEYGSPPK
jgi:hypothetical protein